MCMFRTGMRAFVARRGIPAWKVTEPNGEGPVRDGFARVGEHYCGASFPPTRRNVHGWYAFQHRRDAWSYSGFRQKIVRVLIRGKIVSGDSPGDGFGYRAEYIRRVRKARRG